MKVSFHDPRKSLYELAKKIAYSHYNIEKEFTDWKKDDARLACHTRCIITVENVLFTRIFEEEQLGDQNWYKKIQYFQLPTPSQIKTTQETFDLNLRVVLVTLFFASLETFLRTLFKELFPSSIENQIYKIIEVLLEHLDLKVYQDKFDLYRFLRNSLHNNGIVTDKFAYPIKYNGVTYDFQLGKSVQVNWLMLCQVTSELEDCLNKIIHSKEVMKIKYIKDESYFDSLSFTYFHFESI